MTTPRGNKSHVPHGVMFNGNIVPSSITAGKASVSCAKCKGYGWVPFTRNVKTNQPTALFLCPECYETCPCCFSSGLYVTPDGEGDFSHNFCSCPSGALAEKRLAAQQHKQAS